MDFNGHVDLYLVRHGVTAWNKERKYLGWTDPCLMESEKYQLHSLRNAFKEIQFDRCYSSDLKRCLETLSYIYQTEKLVMDERLRELHFGEWEGKTYEMLKEDNHYKQWLINWETIVPPKGESAKKFQERIHSFLFDLLENHGHLKKHQKLLIVTHGGVIRYILSLFMKDLSFWEIPVKNNAGYVLHHVKNRKGDWTCFSYSEVPLVENANM